MSLVTAAALSRLFAACTWVKPEGPMLPGEPPEPFPVPFDGGVDREPRLEQALGDTVNAAEPPPPISGGTLLITHDDRFAIASDPDHDRVHVVDLSKRTLAGSIGLQRGDEPGRVVEDAAGRVHALLRRGGAVVTFDPTERVISARREVCPSPRGVAYQPGADVIHVACQGGELVTLPASGGAATRTLHLDDDLRDVVWNGRQLFVTRFRSAEALAIDASGAVTSRTRPVATAFSDQPIDTSAGVAWRTIVAPGGHLMMLHQVASAGPVHIEVGGYARGGCGGSIVASALSRLHGDAIPDPPPVMLGGLTLAVDVAISPDGSRIAAAAPGNALLAPGMQVVTSVSAVEDGAIPSGPCGASIEGASVGLTGQAIAVAFDSTGRLYAQTREPATVSAVFETTRYFLGGTAQRDTGHTIFHSDAGGGIACASCHPEGNDDGRVWNFDPIGPRRTQSLRGGILGTAPFHWDGDMTDFAHLTAEVLGRRMNGGELSVTRSFALSRWLDAQPALPRVTPTDAASAARGEALFHDPTVGCASCHEGDALTNNTTVDVGTGAAFQVPTLRGLKYRAPYMHNGCAPTLRARFTDTRCGGGDLHGRTSQLTERDVSDLVAWLETQ